MEIEKLIILGIITFFTSVVSGVGGGGGGFITTPFMIFLGLTPQQAVASGKIGGLGVTLGSLQGLTKAKVHKWKPVIGLMVLAIIVGLVTPHIITSLDNETYKKIIGVLLILLIPIVLFKKIGQKTRNPAPWQRLLAIPLLTFTLLLQGVFSGGMGTLVVLTLMSFVGMDALEANVTKRFSQVLLNVIIVIGLIGSGLILWEVSAVLFFSGTLGGYIGSQIAIKKGNKFISYVFAFLMFISGIGLLIS